MSQNIFSADNNYEDLTKYFKKNNIDNIFIVCSKFIKKLKIYNYLKELDINITYFSDFKPNPDYESVCIGVEKFRKSNSQYILAIGGGSAIDVAKCIKLYCTMNDDENYLIQKKIPNDIELIAIPTTAGTGSESTKFAVIYYKGEKQSIKDESIIPSSVLFDPSILETLSVYQKKSTLLDALSHSIESMWSVNSTDKSKEYSINAIKIINENIDRYLNGDSSINEIMFYASNIAGKAINITETTAGHAMCYKLTSLYKIAHGHAAALVNSVLFPYMVENINNCIDDRGQEYLLTVFNEITTALGYDLNDGVNYLELLLEKLGLYDVSISYNDIEALVNSVNTTRLKNNPVILSKNDIKQIYMKLFDKIEKRKKSGSKRVC